MNDDTTGKTSATDWRRLRSMTDEEVHAAILDDPDAKPTDEGFWKASRVVSSDSNGRVGPTKNIVRLAFRSDIHFDAQNDDAIIWGDQGDRHFRLVIRRRLLLLRKYGLKKYFDQSEAEIIIKKHRGIFEELAQNAYDAGASEIIIG